MWLKKVSLLVLFVLLSVSVFAQLQGTTSYIDQAFNELNNIEQNQTALKNLLAEREATIAEKERLLNQMTLQYQSLEASFLLLKNVNKLSNVITISLGVALLAETVYIVVKNTKPP